MFLRMHIAYPVLAVGSLFTFKLLPNELPLFKKAIYQFGIVKNGPNLSKTLD